MHACLVCNGPHPMVKCPQKPKGKGDAAGRIQCLARAPSAGPKREPQPSRPARAISEEGAKANSALRLRVLHLFAGGRRHSEIATYLEALCTNWGDGEAAAVTFCNEEVDTLWGGKEHNLLVADLQNE